ncbi:MAG: hypothetical protein RI988_2543 [Pseudomonadota bacterium]
MKDIFEAWWRALLHCVHPRVLLWSLLPLVVASALVAGLGWAFWEPAVAAVRAWLEQWSLVTALLQWLDTIGAPGLRTVLAPLIVVVLTVPVVVVAALLLVAWLMTPALASFVAKRRFPELERRGGASAWWQGLAWSLGCTAVAVFALLATLPLWLVPPLALVLPPLIWGWLAARVFAFDTLAAHATVGERRLLLHTARWPLLGIGVATGLLGSAPSLLWAAGALSLVFAPVLAVLAVWVYTLIFAFAALWFAHFTLARLARLREAVARQAPGTPEPAPPPALPSPRPLP